MSIGIGESLSQEQKEIALKGANPWKNKLNGRRLYPSQDGNNFEAFKSTLRFAGDNVVHMVFDPDDKYRLAFQFVNGNEEIISIAGHRYSSFRSHDGVLYFANFSPDSPGCEVVAYDLVNGKELWRTELSAPAPPAASAYRNRVIIHIALGLDVPKELRAKDAAFVKITGLETFCDYVEVLDVQTGKSLTIKEHRVGFEGGE